MKQLLLQTAQTLGGAAILIFCEIFLIVLVTADAEPEPNVTVMSFVFLMFALAVHGIRSLQRLGTLWLLLAFQFSVLAISAIAGEVIHDFAALRVAQGVLAVGLLVASILVYLGRTRSGPESTQ